MDSCSKYQKTLELLYKRFVFKGIKLGVSNMKKLQEAFEFPDRSFPIIHVAGTNGKGSVSTKVAACLKGKVGIFTSPHISSFRERIQINDSMISEDEIVSYVEKILAVEGILPTFFEITVMIALLYFRDQQVDHAVLEVGLGGLYDATNIVEGKVAVITSIAFDHEAYLGNTLEEIAKNKAGIIKPNSKVVLGPSAAKFIETGNTSYIIGKKFKTADEENSEIAKIALRAYNKPHDLKGLSVRPKCRMETIAGVILDVAHNVAAIKELLSNIKGKIHVIFGSSEDKDYKSSLALIKSRADVVHLYSNFHERAHDFQQENIPVLEAKKIAEEAGSTLVVCGSFFLMSDIRKQLGVDEVTDPTLSYLG